MNRFKRFLGGFIAAATVITSVGFTASAYDVCDVNQDGKVDTRDVSAISRYLSGNVKVSDYSKLDVNKSLIVDYMDEQCVLAKVMGWSYSSSYYSKKNKTSSTAPSVSTITLNNDANSTAERKYRKYSYITQKEMSSYTLNLPTSPINSSSAEERGIIGTDDRYASTGSENAGIVQLYHDKDTTDDEYYLGTGFIVDDHHIATAAHCVIDKTNEWFSTMKITVYGYNGELSTHEFTPVEAHIPSQYKPNDKTVTNLKYDYALITVKEDLSGYFHFNLGEAYNANGTNYSNIPIHVTGYSQDSTLKDGNPTERLYTAEGRVLSETVDGSYPVNNRDMLYYNTDVEPGCSGGPVYVVTTNKVNGQSSYKYIAVAISDSGAPDNTYNCGPLITKYLIQFYKNNNYANY